MKPTFWCITGHHAEFLAEVADEDEAEMVKRSLKESVKEAGKTASKEVIVTAVLPEFQKYLASGDVKEPCETGHIFKNGVAATDALGLKWNQVANTLARAKREGKRRAVVRGLELAYYEDTYGD